LPLFFFCICMCVFGWLNFIKCVFEISLKLMQINKLLSIIYKFVKIVYKKTTYKNIKIQFSW
jgi:hypothetical protein